MFERFTERARQVVVLAQEEARTLKHNYIGTEHILLGLLREEEGLAARVLESLEITVERVRAQVVRIVGSGEEVTSGQIPFTPRAKKVLELALREALSLGHNYIGTEHILLGLVRENEGVAARILLDFGADPEAIRTEVIRTITGQPRPDRYEPSRSNPLLRAGLDPHPYAGLPAPLDAPLDLGWRERPIALAALGAAVLARQVFDRPERGSLDPLQTQLLLRLALGPADAPPTDSGELIEALVVSLACDRDDLRLALRHLQNQGLVVCQTEEDEDVLVLLTAPGATRVREWLHGAASLFGRWPPDNEGVDDAAG
jgi:hypothetical protein